MIFGHLDNLLRVHADAAMGAVIGFTSGMVAQHPDLGELPLWARFVIPMLSSMLPVVGRALWNEIRPAEKGVAAGMRAKARLLRDRADKKAAAGDVKGADALRDTADNLESAAAAIDAATEN